jgi:hypothetical protein
MYQEKSGNLGARLSPNALENVAACCSGVALANFVLTIHLLEKVAACCFGMALADVVLTIHLPLFNFII